MNHDFTYKGVKIAPDYDASVWHQRVCYYCPDLEDVDCPGPNGSLRTIMEGIDEWRASWRESMERRVEYLCELLRNGSEEHAYVDYGYIRREIESTLARIEELRDDS